MIYYRRWLCCSDIHPDAPSSTNQLSCVEFGIVTKRYYCFAFNNINQSGKTSFRGFSNKRKREGGCGERNLHFEYWFESNFTDFLNGESVVFWWYWQKFKYEKWKSIALKMFKLFGQVRIVVQGWIFPWGKSFKLWRCKDWKIKHNGRLMWIDSI